jgi:hypothetical protein
VVPTLWRKQGLRRLTFIHGRSLSGVTATDTKGWLIDHPTADYKVDGASGELSRVPLLTAGFTLIDRFLQDMAPICCLYFDRIGVRHPGIGASADSPIGLKKLGVRVSHSIFGLQGLQRLAMHARGVSLIFPGDLIIETGYAQGTWLQHRASCRDAGPQYDQKVNNKLRPYPVGNGLSK